MRQPVGLIAGLLFAVTVGAQSYAQVSAQNTIMVDHPWARATPGGAKTGAAYMTLVNNGNAVDRLVSATTPVADKVQFHSVSEENGVSRMHEMPSIDLAPGGKATFSPGGMHIMVVGLKKPLKEGEYVPDDVDFREGRQSRCDGACREGWCHATWGYGSNDARAGRHDETMSQERIEQEVSCTHSDAQI